MAFKRSVSPLQARRKCLDGDGTGQGRQVGRGKGNGQPLAMMHYLGSSRTDGPSMSLKVMLPMVGFEVDMRLYTILRQRIRPFGPKPPRTSFQHSAEVSAM